MSDGETRERIAAVEERVAAPAMAETGAAPS